MVSAYLGTARLGAINQFFFVASSATTGRAQLYSYACKLAGCELWSFTFDFLQKMFEDLPTSETENTNFILFLQIAVLATIVHL